MLYILYELVGRQIGFETGEKHSTIGKTLLIQKIDATGVSYTLVARDYTLTNGSAAFGEHFAVDPLLKGWKDNDHTYTLTFSDGSVAAP